MLQRGGVEDDVGAEGAHAPRASAPAVAHVGDDALDPGVARRRAPGSRGCGAGTARSSRATRRSLAPKATARAQISEPIEPPPPVTRTRLPRMNASSRARSICTVGRSSRSSISSGASSASRMPSPRLVTRDSGRPSRRARAMSSVGIAPPARARSASRRGAGSRRRAPGNPAPPGRDRRRSPSTGTPRIDWPRSSSRCERMPFGWSFFARCRPRSRAAPPRCRSPRPSSRVGVLPSALQGVARAGVLQVAEGQARAAEQEHLHEPVERDRDLAEEVEAVELRRDENVVDDEERRAPAPSRRGRC